MGRVGKTLTLSAALLMASCAEPLVVPPPDQVQIPDGAVLFEVANAGEPFQVAVVDGEVIETLQGLLEAGEQASVLAGELRPGNGGFNAPYDWHLDPASVRVPDVAIELCDGRPSHVQENLDYWLETVKQFCPWGVEILSRT